MKPKRAKFIRGAELLLLSLFITLPLQAQATSTLSGAITNPLGSPIANARISAKQILSGHSADTQSDSAGRYSLPNLAPGDYEVSVAAQGFATKVTHVLLSAGAQRTLDVSLTGTETSAAAPSLSDLGFSRSLLHGSAQEQALLNKRSHMLQIHQKLGLITAGAMVAALLTSSGAKGHHGLPGSASGRDLHMALGGATGALYIASAYYAIRAPKVPGVEIRGPIRLHKALAWIHGPGMVLTTILGIMAYQQLSNGERVHGIAKAHSTAALVTAAAFGGAILSVSFKF
jgi:Carboxypeptidase regulatory-like domain